MSPPKSTLAPAHTALPERNYMVNFEFFGGLAAGAFISEQRHCLDKHPILASGRSPFLGLSSLV